MKTIRMEEYKDFMEMAQYGITVAMRGKMYTVIDTAKDYLTHGSTYEAVVIMKEFLTGKYVGFTFKQLKGKRITYGYVTK